VRVLEGVDTMPFDENDYNTLARNNLNGRQVCSSPSHLVKNILLTVK